jgi:hypothetical protein
MLRPSLLVWELIKPMQYIQYPWRFLLFLIPISAFVSAVVAGMVKRTWILFIVACVSLLLVIRYNPVLYEPRNEAYYLARQNFTDGTSSMGNSFSTIWTGWKDKRPEGPVSVQNGSIMSAPVQRFLDKQFVVSMSDKGDMMVNTLYFPGWIATIDNKEAPIYYQMDGIIHIIVPQGNHIVRVTFTDTTPRKLGNAISILSLATLATWGILRTRRKAQL